jgi:WhiB family transcriptional regulator, redox-sensing transcriptional regulator
MIGRPNESTGRDAGTGLDHVLDFLSTALEYDHDDARARSRMLWERWEPSEPFVPRPCFWVDDTGTPCPDVTCPSSPQLCAQHYAEFRTWLSEITRDARRYERDYWLMGMGPHVRYWSSYTSRATVGAGRGDGAGRRRTRQRRVDEWGESETLVTRRKAPESVADPTMISLPRWHTNAACRHEDRDVFFPRYETRPAVAKAKSICETCPVRESCLIDALSYVEEGPRGALHVPAGVVGGTTAAERKALVERLRAKHEDDADASPVAA